MALITNTDTSILPYNTKYMEYDLNLGYVLTNEAIRDFTGYDFILLSGTEEKANVNRYRITRDVMNVIRSYSLNGKEFNYKKYQIAKDADVRQVFQEALIEQALYYIESGAGSIKTQHGIDISKGKAIDINVLRGKSLLSVSAEMLLHSVGLLFSGWTYLTNYSEDGTW